MDLRSFGRALRKSWWLVLVVVVVCTGVAALLTASTDAKYASKVTFFAAANGSDATGNALQATQYAQLQVNSFVDLLSSDALAERVAKQPGVGLDQTAISKEISGSSATNTLLLTATVTDTSKARSLAIATGIGKVLPGMVTNYLKTKTVLTVVSGPTAGNSPVSPHKALNYGLGFLIGLALGLAIAFTRELLDTSMRGSQAVEEVAGVPVVGSIAYEKDARKAPLIVEGKVRSTRAEAFRELRTNLQFIDVDKPVGVIVLTSSVAAEGKSTTAANLALVFAESGRRVLLIEADLRRPRVTDYMGLDRTVGLTNVLAGQVTIDEVLQPWGTGGLTVLPSGSIPPNPSELLGSKNMRDTIAGLRERFEMIIVDTPPLLPVTDAAVASAFADGVIVVVRHAKTSRAQLQATIKALESVDANILGAVLNMRPSKGDVKGRYDGYGYYEDAPGATVGTAAEDTATAAQAPEPAKEYAASNKGEVSND